MIVTGNCSGIQDTHENRTVSADKDDQLVGCHFDGYSALAMLGAGDKIFRTCSPLTLSMSPKTNVNNPNEWHDIDTLFCEVGEWYLLHLKSGRVRYLSAHFWHEVSSTPSSFACLDVILAH